MTKYTMIISKNAEHPQINQYYQLQYYFPNSSCEEICYIETKEQAAICAREAVSSFRDFLVVFAEEQILLEVMSQIHTDELPILYIPENPKSDMAYNVNYEEDLQTYIKEALDNPPIYYDIFHINQKPFLFAAQRGIDLNLQTLLNEKEENKQNLMKLKQALKKQQMYSLHMNIDGEYISRKCLGCIVTNTKMFGSLPVKKEIQLEDDKAEIILLYPKVKLREFTNKESWEDLSFTEILEGKNIRLYMETKNNIWQLDNKPYLPYEKETFEIEPVRKIALMHANQKK